MDRSRTRYAPPRTTPPTNFIRLLSAGTFAPAQTNQLRKLPTRSLPSSSTAGLLIALAARDKQANPAAHHRTLLYIAIGLARELIHVLPYHVSLLLRDNPDITIPLNNTSRHFMLPKVETEGGRQFEEYLFKGSIEGVFATDNGPPPTSEPSMPLSDIKSLRPTVSLEEYKYIGNERSFDYIGIRRPSTNEGALFQVKNSWLNSLVQSFDQGSLDIIVFPPEIDPDLLDKVCSLSRFAHNILDFVTLSDVRACT